MKCIWKLDFILANRGSNISKTILMHRIKLVNLQIVPNSGRIDGTVHTRTFSSPVDALNYLLRALN
jgi:hypothetical protein